MSDLILNGEFTIDLSDWTVVASVVRSVAHFNVAPASALFSVPVAGTAAMRQDVATPAGGPYWWTLKFSHYGRAAATNGWAKMRVQIYNVGISPSYLDYYYKYDTVDTWKTESSAFVMPPSTNIRIYLSTPLAVGDYVYVDSISLTSAAYAPATRQGLMWELQKRRRDWGSVKHVSTRSLEIINFALAQAPMRLWRVDEDITTLSVADTTRYSLAALTAITNPRQVRRVWLHDGETPGAYDQIGRWTIEEDWAGTPLTRTLYLVLDEAPATAGTIIKIEYFRPHDELTDDEDYAVLIDWEWIIAKAMTLLLLEADPTLEPPEQIERDLRYWDQQRAQREVLVMPRPPAGKVRTRIW